MEFIEAPAFTRHLPDYLDDDGYGDLQAKLARQSRAWTFDAGNGRVPEGTLGGCAARQGPQRRVADYLCHFKSDSQIWLMTLYGKDEASDLTAREKKALQAAIESELETRAIRRAIRVRGSRRTR
jgi:hypothetical protein